MNTDSAHPQAVLAAGPLVPSQGHRRELGIPPASGVDLLVTDAQVASLLARDARQRALTGVFGVPRDEQSWLVTAILCGAVAAVVWDAVAKPGPVPTPADFKIAGAVVNTAFGALAGTPSSAMPLAGTAIALALLAHHAHRVPRKALLGVRTANRELHAAFQRRYGHLIPTARERLVGPRPS